MARALKVTGLKEMQRNLRALHKADHVTAAVARAVYTHAEGVMTAAKKQTPVETGALRASGTVLPPKIAGSRITVTMGFGGAAAKYAIFVHERLDLRHTVGNAKFLERPFFERLSALNQKIARAAGRAIRLEMR